MFTYQLTNRYFGQIADELTEAGSDELRTLGAREIKPGYRGVYFTADRDALYRIVYCCRLFTRILAPLLVFDCHSTKYLYRTAREIDWPGLFDVGMTLGVDANVSHSRIRHSQYAALCLKDAAVDSFRDACGKRPDIDAHWPDMRLNLHIRNDKATISMDISGGSLHRRGYRQESVAAPMQETVAAAAIRLSGWNGETPLHDPMCGAGTLLAEALMHYCRIPASFLRKQFGCGNLPDFDKDVWQTVKKKEDGRIRKLPDHLILGSDKAKKAVAASAVNLGTLPHGDKIDTRVMRFQDIPAIENSTIVCNPPYGLRAETDGDMDLFMSELGSFLKHRCKGSTAYIYYGRPELMKKIGLRTSWKKPLKNGGLDGRLAKYELY